MTSHNIVQLFIENDVTHHCPDTFIYILYIPAYTWQVCNKRVKQMYQDFVINCMWLALFGSDREGITHHSSPHLLSSKITQHVTRISFLKQQMLIMMPQSLKLTLLQTYQVRYRLWNSWQHNSEVGFLFWDTFEETEPVAVWLRNKIIPVFYRRIKYKYEFGYVWITKVLCAHYSYTNIGFMTKLSHMVDLSV